ncbi:cleft lip and palate associated transmembrane protein [Lentinula aciculospora]|uniref:Cleft lip and palate associated transmembrane protein n=1 Tax=Lentinula aciculospora TaxID=153920 RepID=A0A9W9ACV8_9AGAR|nr:cleft lip and palate associated transmembrane protein [Lentinula aciculospora]
MSSPQQQAASPAAGAAPATGDRRQEEESPFKKFFGIAQQLLLVWVVSQMVTKYFAPKATTPTVQTTTGPPAAGESHAQNVVNPWLLPPAQANPGWPFGASLDMHVYLSTSPNGDVFSRQWTSGYRKDRDEGLPNFVWKNITYGDYAESRVVEYDIVFPETVLRNGTLWADVFLTKEGTSPDPQNERFNPEHIHHVRKLLTPYMARPKVRKEKNLLKGSREEDVEEELEEPDVIMPHWHKNITLALVSDSTTVPYAQLPPPLLERNAYGLQSHSFIIAQSTFSDIHLIPNQRDTTGTKGIYKPIVFPNEFWHLRSHYVELNSSTPSMPIQITFQPMSYMKFQIFASMTHGFNEAAKQQGAGAGAELDEIKRMLIETNPWFLGLTGLVSVLHMVFEMLAFKSDVSHWRQKKEMVGVSVRSVAYCSLPDVCSIIKLIELYVPARIVTNVFVQIVILLYLIDNNENTSWMILFGSGMGVIIEAWKITKAVDISIVAAAGSWFPYKLDIKDKHVLSEDEKKTQEYDQLAFRYVSYVAIPTLAAYTIYSLMYESHRGWYSFIIGTLTSYVYMFGFAQLVPQLIINYKLKSVAHMPMKAMIYKTLSTVVDDFFAFCIKMPFLHRLACFRDDVVFLIFLYQRWIYRIDPKRINEYGQVLSEDIKAIDPVEDSDKESKKKR